MIAAGNTLVVNPHPGGRRVAAEGVRRYNEAICRDTGIDNLICVITEPTLETADAIFKHRDVALLCVTLASTLWLRTHVHRMEAQRWPTVHAATNALIGVLVKLTALEPQNFAIKAEYGTLLIQKKNLETGG